MRQLRPLSFASLTLGLGLIFLSSGGCGEDGVEKISGISRELVAAADDGVTAMAFAPDGRLFFTEQSTGRVRIVTAEGVLLPQPFTEVEVATGLDWGLLGITLDPEFEANHYVYIYFTEPAGRNKAMPVVMRLTDGDSEGTDPTVLLRFPPANPALPVLVGGGLQFGPDGHLYIGIGDTQRQDLPQDLSSPFGKILRVTRDGDPVPDNPFVDQPDADPRVYAYGLRNTVALTFEPESGRIYAGDNGDLNCDELNIIDAGKNYGWPQSVDVGGAPCQNPDAVEPIYHYAQPGKRPEDVGSSLIPRGIQFVSGQAYPALGDGLLVCEFKTGFMRRLQLGPNKDEVLDDSVVVDDCTLALTASPDGIIYYSGGREIHRLSAD